MGKILELLKKRANSSDWFADESIKAKRLAICKKCEFFIKKTSQCEKCKCFMKLKTRFKGSTCPVGKW